MRGEEGRRGVSWSSLFLGFCEGGFFSQLCDFLFIIFYKKIYNKKTMIKRY